MFSIWADTIELKKLINTYLNIKQQRIFHGTVHKLVLRYINNSIELIFISLLFYLSQRLIWRYNRSIKSRKLLCIFHQNSTCTRIACSRPPEKIWIGTFPLKFKSILMEELTISPPDTRSLCTVFYMIIHNSLFPEEKFCVNICLMPKFFQTPWMVFLFARLTIPLPPSTPHYTKHGSLPSLNRPPNHLNIKSRTVREKRRELWYTLWKRESVSLVSTVKLMESLIMKG